MTQLRLLRFGQVPLKFVVQKVAWPDRPAYMGDVAREQRDRSDERWHRHRREHVGDLGVVLGDDVGGEVPRAPNFWHSLVLLMALMSVNIGLWSAKLTG